jgi:iron complex transport system permease protein
LRRAVDHTGCIEIAADPRFGDDVINNRSVNILLLALICGAALLSLAAGQSWISPWHAHAGTPEAWILWELRAPRVVLALGIGAVLGLSGAVLQGLTRNPLADSGVLGISACAALGAVLAIFFNLQNLHPQAVSFAAIIGAAVGMLLLALLLTQSGSITGFLLAGVMLSSLAGAATALLISLAPNPFATAEIVTWLMGALTDRSWLEVSHAVPLMLAGSLLMLFTGRALDALGLGEAVAVSLGVSLKRTQLLTLAGVALGVGAAVSVGGIIGFVGLVVPHGVRRFAGATPSGLLLPSALGGALLVLVADTLVRVLPTTSELKLGILLSLIGAPVFLLVLTKHRRDLA